LCCAACSDIGPFPPRRSSDLLSYHRAAASISEHSRWYQTRPQIGVGEEPISAMRVSALPLSPMRKWVLHRLQSGVVFGTTCCARSEEHTSELQSQSISYAVFC